MVESPSLRNEHVLRLAEFVGSRDDWFNDGDEPLPGAEDRVCDKDTGLRTTS